MTFRELFNLYVKDKIERWDSALIQARGEQLMIASHWYSKSGMKPPSLMDIYAELAPDDPKIARIAADDEAVYQKRQEAIKKGNVARQARWSKMAGRQLNVTFG